MPGNSWQQAKNEARDKEFHGSYDIWGGDIDPQAVAIARSNAHKAGVAEDTSASRWRTLRTFHRDSPYGQLVTNPPYGQRLMEKQEAEELYREFGKVWRTFAGGLAHAGAFQPHGVRAHLRPAGRQKEKAVQRHDKV